MLIKWLVTCSIMCVTVTKLTGMSKKDSEKHLTTLSDLLCSDEKGPPSQKRSHLLTYATIISGHAQFADFLAKKSLISILTKQLKDASHIDT